MPIVKNKILMNSFLIILATTAFVSTVFASEGPIPKGLPKLDHVFLIMLENTGYKQIIGNPNAPFINQYAKTTNLATNYFAIEHPSLSNYLDIVGGSNFGVQGDCDPDWHNTQCKTEIARRAEGKDVVSSLTICPIWGVGTDAESPPKTLKSSPLTSNSQICYPATANVSGKMIGDQLVESGQSWKTYQQSLPSCGPDRVNFSDSVYTNNTDFSTLQPATKPALCQSDIVMLYAVKHNPFAYFRSVQEGTNPNNSLNNVVGFEGLNGLFADLRTGNVPNFAFISPNQCSDMHGQGNAGPFCAAAALGSGSAAALNPALIYHSDKTIEGIVSAIHESPVWKKGRAAIVVVWDEDDYSASTHSNQVALIVDTNYGKSGMQSSRFYTHYSLLKSLESGFGLPCLNHACDSKTAVITDLFAPKKA